MYFLNSRTAKAQASLCKCKDTPEHSLLTYSCMDIDEDSGQRRSLDMLKTSAWLFCTPSSHKVKIVLQRSDPFPHVEAHLDLLVQLRLTKPS